MLDKQDSRYLLRSLRRPMTRRNLARAANALGWAFAAIMALTNLLLVWRQADFVRIFNLETMAPTALRLDAPRSGEVVVEDAQGPHVFTWAGLPPPLEQWLQNCRIEFTVEHAFVALETRSPESHEWREVQVCRAQDVWHPTPSSPLRFVVRHDLQVGAYELRARLFAPIPWGDAPAAEGPSDIDLNTIFYRPVIPGRIYLMQSTTPPMRLEIE